MFTLNCKGRLLVVDRPLVMGIINTTPDSFYAGSRYEGDSIIRQAEKMIGEGATILDMGGQSTRPGSVRVSVEEELKRVMEPLMAVHRQFPEVFISIDTYYAKVAAEAVATGASIINDVSGGSQDPDMIATAGRLRVPYVLTHLQGTLDTMQLNPVYEHMTREVLDYFIQGVARCRQAGIHDIILDPGFGFGKTHRHNFELLKHLGVFHQLGLPLLLGVSRKGTIYKTLGTTAAAALNGTTVLNTLGLMNGVHILRVHDVREAMEVIRLWEVYQE